MCCWLVLLKWARTICSKQANDVVDIILLLRICGSMEPHSNARGAFLNLFYPPKATPAAEKTTPLPLHSIQ